MSGEQQVASDGRVTPGGSSADDAALEAAADSALALAAELSERVGRERQALREMHGQLLTQQAIQAASHDTSLREDVAPPVSPAAAVGQQVTVTAPTPTPLAVTVARPSHGSCRIAVVGDVDADVAPWLRQTLVDVVDDAGPGELSLDLSGVSFMDSAGLGALLHVRRWALASGSHLRVVDVSPELRRLLRITGVHTVLLDEA